MKKRTSTTKKMHPYQLARNAGIMAAMMNLDLGAFVCGAFFGAGYTAEEYMAYRQNLKVLRHLNDGVSIGQALRAADPDCENDE